MYVHTILYTANIEMYLHTPITIKHSHTYPICMYAYITNSYTYYVDSSAHCAQDITESQERVHLSTAAIVAIFKPFVFENYI